MRIVIAGGTCTWRNINNYAHIRLSLINQTSHMWTHSQYKHKTETIRNVIQDTVHNSLHSILPYSYSILQYSYSILPYSYNILQYSYSILPYSYNILTVYSQYTSVFLQYSIFTASYRSPPLHMRMRMTITTLYYQ